MNAALFSLEWLGFLVRWAHLIFGISWIGSSFYFMWLDSHLEEPEAANGVRESDRKSVEGVLWMTHSGGFYQVLRKKIAPGEMPRTLHWFKYEALFTWVSGIFLLGLVYYLSDGAYLVDPSVSSITTGSAIALSIALFVFSWVAYDALWVTVGRKLPSLATAICLAGIVGLAYLLCSVYSGRAAFIHMGAVFGTIMVANVWVRILPSQQKMIDATERGEAPDFNLSAIAKRRSVHNSYMTFPVLFMMLSNHYAMAFGHPQNWVILLLLVAFGISLRHVMIAKNGSGKWALVPTALSLGAAMVMTAPRAPIASDFVVSPTKASFQQVHAIVQSRCLSCHSSKPHDATFGPSPSGVSFDDPKRIKTLAERIKVRVVDTKTMPFLNKTGMTDEERAVIASWIEQGAPFDDSAR
jgi:uncharacterized membrane protein